MTRSGEYLSLVSMKEFLHYTTTAVAVRPIPTELGPGKIRFFTDGSGAYQTDLDARLSAWSVVMCRGSIEQCIEHFQRMRVTRQIPDCFQVVATAQCSSEQSVPRAELEAVVAALEAYPGATVYTDCESVVKIWESTRLKLCQVLLSNSSNADLVRRLLAVVQCPGQSVIKVKAHIDPLSCADDFIGFLQLGNQIADEAAKAALSAIPCDLTDAARKIFVANKARKIKLREVLEYAARVTITYLQKCQAKADDSDLDAALQRLTAASLAVGLPLKLSSPLPRHLQLRQISLTAFAELLRTPRRVPLRAASVVRSSSRYLMRSR